MRGAVKRQGEGQNLVLDALRASLRGPHDCGGPLDGWGLSAEDLRLFSARHRAIQNGAAGTPSLILPGRK